MDRPETTGAPRTLLFCPGTRPDRYQKALLSGACAIVFDLEDSVADTQKSVARARAQEGLMTLRRNVPIWVRTNAVDTPHFAEDVAMAVHGSADGIILPSVEDPTSLALALETIKEQGPPRRDPPPWLCITLETARGITCVGDLIPLARASVDAFMFGSVDLAAELGIDADDRPHPLLVHARSTLLIAARAADCIPMDGVLLDLDDEQRMESDTLASAQTGFRGRAVVHPCQVGPAARAYRTHDRPNVAWARRVVDQFEVALSEGTASIAVGGRMVDYPVYEAALNTLRRTEGEPPICG